MKTNHVQNFVTFDIEKWCSANYNSLDVSRYRDQSTHLDNNVDLLLEICNRHNIRSTCFIVGDIAQNKPELVRKIHRSGHEIASHSFAHDLIYKMTPEQFRDDLRISCDMLEQITAEKVVGYRAPSWSVKKETLPWFYPILEEQGIKYSSSVFPGKTFLYGIPGFPEAIHQPVIDGKKQAIWEIPQKLFSFFGKKYGFSGGFYLRTMPAWFISQMIRSKNRSGKNVFLYLHPREIDLDSPKLKLHAMEHFIHYHGVKGCDAKFDHIVGRFALTFIRMDQFVSNLNATR